jgi:hypothetical protein
MKNFTQFGMSPRRGSVALIGVLVVMLTSFFAVPGQTPPASQTGEMRKLDFLAGEWKGKGWLYSVQGQKSEISQSTKISVEADGAVLRIKDARRLKEGTLLPMPMRLPESSISYDEEAKLYRWRVDSFRGPGNPFEAKLIESRTFQLIQHTQDGMGRNTIRVIEDGQWHETFELLLSDGWFKVQETVLKKVK